MRLFITKLIVKLVLISLPIVSCLCAPMNIKQDNMLYLQYTGHGSNMRHLLLMTMYVPTGFANHFKYQ